MKPEIIQYETQCLPTGEAEELEHRLRKDYTIVRFGNDSIALREAFLMRYLEQLYVEQGVATILGDRIAAVRGGAAD